MNFKTAFCLLLCFASTIVYSQTSTLWLLNGKKINVNKIQLLTNDGEYILQYNTLKGNDKYVDINDVYSYTKPDSAEVILYKYNIELGNDLEVGQMHSFLTGKADFKDKYKANWFLVGGVVTGASIGFIPSVQIGNIPSGGVTIPLSPLVPLAYIVFAGNSTMSINKIKQKYPDLNTDEYYLLGCQDEIQKKRFKKSAIGAGIGIVAGLVTSFIINQ